MPGVPSVVVGLVQERGRFGLIKCNALATRNPSPIADTVEAGELMAARIIKMLESRVGSSPNLMKVGFLLTIPFLAVQPSRKVYRGCRSRDRINLHKSFF